jgi:hypothetical protein
LQITDVNFFCFTFGCGKLNPLAMNNKLLYFFIVVSLTVQGQTNVYHPFPDSGAVWGGTFWGLYSNCLPVYCGFSNHYFIYQSGDTIISGNNYTKLYQSGFHWGAVCGSCVVPYYYYYDTYRGAIRQDTFLRKVFFVPPSSPTDTLLYNFNLSPGDTLPPSCNNMLPDVYIVSIDSILIGTDYRKRFILNIEMDFGVPGCLIEGIGSNYGLLDMMLPPFEHGASLNCFSVNGQTLYPDTTAPSCNGFVGVNEIENLNLSISLSPNPATSEIKIENAKGKIESVEVFDVVGVKVKYLTPALSEGEGVRVEVSSLAAGIYFVKITTEDGIFAKKLIKQ